MKKISIWIILLILLMGCSPVGTEPAADVEQSLPEGDAALNTAVPPTPGPEEQPVESQPSEPEPVDEEETAVPDPEEEIELQEVDPASVDLRLMTPEPIKGGDLIVQPAPGVPGEPAENPELVAAVIADLSERLGIDEGEINFEQMVETEWRDSSLGCPQPNMNYLQMITPGFQIVLSVGEQMHYYHTRDTAFFIYCQNSQPTLPPNLGPPSADE